MPIPFPWRMHRGHRPLGCVDSFFARHFVDTVFDNKKNLKKFPQIIYEQETKKQPNKKENKIKVECLFPACPWPVKDQICVPSATKVSNGIGAFCFMVEYVHCQPDLSHTY